MTKYQISHKILALLDYDADEIVDAIYRLAEEVEEDGDLDDLLEGIGLGCEEECT